MSVLKIEKIGQVAIAVNDIEQARNFYQNILSLPLLFDAGPVMSFYQCGETRLMVTLQQGSEKDHKTSVIYYKVNDLDASVAILQQHNIHFEQLPSFVAAMPEYELWMSFIRDPSNNLIGIMAEKPLSKNQIYLP